MANRFVKFNKLVITLLDLLESKTRDKTDAAAIYRLRSRLNALISTVGIEEPISRSSGVFLKYNAQISASSAERDEFYLNCDPRAEYVALTGKQPPSEDDFIFLLIDSVKSHYRAAEQVERDAVGLDVITLLELCIEHELSKRE